ncbi:MAG: hypothetical protein WAO71_02645 [Gallionella sp.]
MIQGRIARHPKNRPAKLIVNGAPMPISVDENSNFSRPYSFGSGSNNVEIRSADGKQVQRVQFYDRNPDKAPARLRVILSWDSDSTDLDLHVISPDGAHVFYGNRVAKNGAALDVDVTTGYGPEIYANPSPQWRVPRFRQLLRRRRSARHTRHPRASDHYFPRRHTVRKTPNLPSPPTQPWGINLD